MTSARHHRRAPGIRQWLPLPIGHPRQYQRDPIGTLLSGARQFGDVFRIQVGPMVIHVLSHPDHVKHVLQEHPERYPRSRLYRVFEAGVGKGLITSEGAPWYRQRRMATPAFDQPRLARFANTITEATAAMIARWQPYAQNGQPLNVASEMMCLTLQRHFYKYALLEPRFMGT